MLLDERPAPAAGPAAPAIITLSESSDLVLRLYPDEPSSFQARVYAGNVLVASTLESDRPDFLMQMFLDADGGEESFACSGRLSATGLDRPSCPFTFGTATTGGACCSSACA